MHEKEPQEPPEYTSEHVKSQNFLGPCPQTPPPLTQSILQGPTFWVCPGPPNPLSGPDWEAVKILQSEPHHLKKRVLEATWIKETSRNWNLDCGLVLNQTWLPLFWMNTWHPHSLLSITITLTQQSILYISLYQSCIVRILIIQLTKVHVNRNILHCYYAMLI